MLLCVGALFLVFFAALFIHSAKISPNADRPPRTKICRIITLTMTISGTGEGGWDLHWQGPVSEKEPLMGTLEAERENAPPFT